MTSESFDHLEFARQQFRKRIPTLELPRYGEDAVAGVSQIGELVDQVLADAITRSLVRREPMLRCRLLPRVQRGFATRHVVITAPRTP